MLKHRIQPGNTLPTAIRSSVAEAHHALETPAPPLQGADIDELIASPWIGLHYRHEFRLPHRHEPLDPCQQA